MPKQRGPGGGGPFQDHRNRKSGAQQQNRGHLLEKKSSVRTRRLAQTGLSPADRKSVRRMLGI